MVDIGHQADKGAMCRTYRSSVCRSDNKIDMIKASLAVNGCSGGENLGRTVAMVEGSYYNEWVLRHKRSLVAHLPVSTQPSITRRYSSLNTHSYVMLHPKESKISTKVRGIILYIYIRSSLLRVSPIPFPSVFIRETRLTVLPRAHSKTTLCRSHLFMETECQYIARCR